MKMKKILNEWRRYVLEESNGGLYSNILGVKPGTIDIFLKAFKDDNTNTLVLKPKIEARYGGMIDALRESDIPPTQKGSAKTSLEKVKKGLRVGQTYWWAQIFGSELAKIIDMKAEMYIDMLKSELQTIRYKKISQEQFDKLPEEKRAAVYEKQYMDANIDSFFDDHVKSGAQNTSGFVGNANPEGAGLHGMMNDFWLSTHGADMLKDAIKSKMIKLPSRDNPLDTEEDVGVASLEGGSEEFNDKLKDRANFLNSFFDNLPQTKKRTRKNK